MSRFLSKLNKRVALLVEDYADSREMLRFLLQGLHWHVLESGDGSEAIKLATIYQPTLIITDLNLPGIDGIELVRELRRSDHWLKIVPIIMLTAVDNETSRHTALAAGVNRFFTKPVNFEFLEAAISELVQETSLQEENGTNSLN
jgi:two-component system cell cycle response regulator